MPHYTDPKRLWFTERGRIGLIEDSTTTTTVDGVSTNIVSISEAKSLLIKGLSLPTKFPVGNDRNYENAYTDNFHGPLDEIPIQFHEALAYKAIAIGYQDPRNMKIELAQYFDNEYEKLCKRAKKFARSNYQTTGQIVPQEY
tara:strand:+ start:1054 stop:1479 length:426 start_codon:yes stop_codon:yes gene_type:complete